jgi:hypothetical protein
LNTRSAGLIAAIAVLTLAGIVGFRAVRASGSGAVTSVKAEAPLSFSSDPLASGSARSEQRTGTTTRTRFAIEVEDVSWHPGDYTVRIKHAGTEIAGSPVTLTVNSLGQGERELDTQDGSPSVPVAVAGDLVEVLDPADGVTVIASDTLVAKP